MLCFRKACSKVVVLGSQLLISVTCCITFFLQSRLWHTLIFDDFVALLLQVASSSFFFRTPLLQCESNCVKILLLL